MATSLTLARSSFLFNRPRNPQKQRQQPFHRQHAFIIDRADDLAGIGAGDGDEFVEHRLKIKAV